MLDLARRGVSLKVVGDQVGCPTWARNLADYSMRAIRLGLSGRKKLPSGIYHACDADPTSWYDFASLVFGTAVELGILERAPDMQKVTSEQFPQRAVRPRWSVLDTGSMQKDLGIRPAPLGHSLAACLQELSADE